MRRQFGGQVDQALIDRYAQSKQWDGSQFQNLEATSMAFSLRKIPGLVYRGIFERDGREPRAPLPVRPFDADAFLSGNRGATFSWYGHSVLLLRMNGKTILIDPMFGPNASPIAPFSVKRFSKDTLDIIDQLPPIDLMLLTHDHYDHLDLASIERLKSRVARYFVALGTGRHLVRWGIEPGLIREFDWWDQVNHEGIGIHFTPTRHFSGRGLRDRQKSLWGGWVLKTPQESIYFSGDSGYGSHFLEVGRRLGPFDIGFMECGQYNENWHQIHMFPEEGVRSALESSVKKAMPVHWGAFSLALHGWKDPVDRFVREAQAQGLPLLHPALGEITSIYDQQGPQWWRLID
jgi:L-ascorbate metabolism protein UlaG (beta-lactamase superfamily)